MTARYSVLICRWRLPTVFALPPHVCRGVPRSRRASPTCAGSEEIRAHLRRRGRPEAPRRSAYGLERYPCGQLATTHGSRTVTDPAQVRVPEAADGRLAERRVDTQRGRAYVQWRSTTPGTPSRHPWRRPCKSPSITGPSPSWAGRCARARRPQRRSRSTSSTGSRRWSRASGAFNVVCRDRALAQARAADAQLAAGIDLGPLHGIPYVAKDLYDVAGLPTTAGTRLLADNVPDRDCTVIGKLTRAGMVLLGKTITVQFAYGGAGINTDQGTPHNPWHPDPHLPGGSSSGTGVAVAAGMAPMGLGTDTGGSVRIPASMCGITGLKTTVGRVSRAGIYPLSRSLDSAGPLTRDAADAAIVYEAMQGPDPADPTTLGQAPHDVDGRDRAQRRRTHLRRAARGVLGRLRPGGRGPDARGDRPSRIPRRTGDRRRVRAGRVGPPAQPPGPRHRRRGIRRQRPPPRIELRRPRSRSSPSASRRAGTFPRTSIWRRCAHGRNCGRIRWRPSPTSTPSSAPR